MTHPKDQREPVPTDAELRRKRATAANVALWHPVMEREVDLGAKNWSWPIDVSRYDRSPSLTPAESAFLGKYFDSYTRNRHAKTLSFDGWIGRLITPIEDVFHYIRVRAACRPWALNYILRETARRERTIWGWSREEWMDTINRRSNDRQSIVAVA